MCPTPGQRPLRGPIGKKRHLKIKKHPNIPKILLPPFAFAVILSPQRLNHFYYGLFETTTGLQENQTVITKQKQIEEKSLGEENKG